MFYFILFLLSDRFVDANVDGDTDIQIDPKNSRTSNSCRVHINIKMLNKQPLSADGSDITEISHNLFATIFVNGFFKFFTKFILLILCGDTDEDRIWKRIYFYFKLVFFSTRLYVSVKFILRKKFFILFNKNYQPCSHYVTTMTCKM